MSLKNNAIMQNLNAISIPKIIIIFSFRIITATVKGISYIYKGAGE